MESSVLEDPLLLCIVMVVRNAKRPPYAPAERDRLCTVKPPHVHLQ